MKRSNSYKNLIVWQKAIDLVGDIYKLTEKFPKSEMYGLSSQMQRAAVAIPSNIAEGQKRTHKKEFIQFLYVSYSSGAELET
ncbi:MAG: four helix bundle protein [Candidatus Moranbacteria bacterium]|nr:four helix bundle protein [Candidatus Moranbacteria bacterium]